MNSSLGTMVEAAYPWQDSKGRPVTRKMATKNCIKWASNPTKANVSQC